MEEKTNNYGYSEMKCTYLKNLRRGLEFAVLLLIVLVGTCMFLRINDYVKINKPNDIKIDKKFSKNDYIYKNYSCYEVDVPPVCINLPQVRNSMKYPELAKQIGLQGRVNATILVGTDGNVIMIGKITGPEILCDEVKNKVIKLKFAPGIKNYNPVSVWINVPFNFKLGPIPHSEFRSVSE